MGNDSAPRTPGKPAEPFVALKPKPKFSRMPFIPPEIVAKIYSYMDEEDKTPLTVCNLALVCESFMHYFTSKTVWNRMKNVRKYSYVLLQNSVTCNIWESDSINNWYKSLKSPSILPSEIWTHRCLLLKVLLWLDVLCAPAKEDFEPYADDAWLAGRFIPKMVDSDCFSCLSKNLRGNKNLVLKAIKKFPKAIKLCPPKLLNDRDFIKKVIDTNGNCLEYLGDYCADSELVVAASRTNIDVLDHAKGQAREDMERMYKYLSKKYASSLANPSNKPDFLISQPTSAKTSLFG